MLKALAPLAALAFVAGAQATQRICHNNVSSTLSEGDCNAVNELKREYLPKDIEEVTVSVKRDGTEIAKFQLSNAAGQDTASGSLDNLEPGTYKAIVVAKALPNSRGNFYRKFDENDRNQSNTCGSNSVCEDCIAPATWDGTLFEGESNPVDIAGTGDSQKVSVFMTSCHPPVSFSTGVFNIPELPTYITQISIISSAAVLGAKGKATITVTVANQNANVNHLPALHAEATSTGDCRRESGSSCQSLGEGQNQINNPAGIWTFADVVDDEPQSGNWPQNYTDNEVTSEGVNTKNDDPANSVFTLSYVVGHAKNTYTTTVTFTPTVFDIQSNTYVTHLAGNQHSADLIIAPVGDLDLEVMYMTGLRVSSIEPDAFTITSDNQHNFNLFKRVENTGNFDQNCINEDLREKGYVIAGAESPNSFGRTANFELEFKADYLYGLSRDVEITTSDIDCIDEYGTNVQLNVVRGLSKDLTKANVWNSFGGGPDSFTIPAGTNPVAGSTELSFPLTLSLTAGVASVFSRCSVTVQARTSDPKPGSTVNDKTTSLTLNFLVAPFGPWCNQETTQEVNVQLKNISNVPCPVLKTIMWGSTSNFLESTACKANGAPYVIKFCVLNNAGQSNPHTVNDYRLEYGDITQSASLFHGSNGGMNVTVDTIDQNNQISIDGVKNDIDATNPCFESKDLPAVTSGELIRQSVKFTVHPLKFSAQLVCTEGSVGTFVRVKAVNKNLGDLETIEGSMDYDSPAITQPAICDDQASIQAFSSDNDKTLICPKYKEVTQSGDAVQENCRDIATTTPTTGGRRRRSLQQASSRSACYPYTCPSDNLMPFDIKIEDGRLTVSMDTQALGDKKVVINANPQGLSPKRSRFIASDFAAASSSWPGALIAKLDFTFQDATMKQNLKPGATVQSLVACCGFTQAEAESLEAAMSSIVEAEDNQVFKPTITIDGGNTGSTSNQKQQTTSTQTTSTHTTEKSSDDSSSSGSLLVVVAVAAVLVLVAVIALAIFTVKSNKQSQRVVDLRGGNDKQSSWQKGGAMESDF